MPVTRTRGPTLGRRMTSWHPDAIVYAVDVKTFQDADGDGVGDFRGLTRRLGHVADLGVNCLWLAPFFPSPLRDDGYDVSDFDRIDPRLGTPADFAAFLAEARRLGLRVIADLVVNHTSDRHPWFQAARSDPRSPYRDFYLWSAEEPPDAREGVVFPGGQDRTWSYDERAGAYNHHRFYHHMPDLNTGNPAVKDELGRVVRTWVERGLDGFRIDAAPFLIEHHPSTGKLVTKFGELKGAGIPNPYGLLDDLRRAAAAVRPDAVLLAEANVDPDEVPDYFGPAASRMQLMFNFLLNQYTALALARGGAAPLAEGWKRVPTPPPPGRWLNYLRNHDELDLGRLDEVERREVFAAFAPEARMRAYGRGVRRRVASMLAGDRRRIELAYSLCFALPGSPMFRYGDEIGMGEDLSLPERMPVRTPMQWDGSANGGFSSAAAGKVIQPVIADGPFGYPTVNVADQDRDPGSLLHWFRRLVRTRRDCPELARGEGEVFDPGHPAVFGLRVRWEGRTLVTLHNLGDQPAEVRFDGGAFADVFGDDAGGIAAGRVRLGGYGYRWLRANGG